MGLLLRSDEFQDQATALNKNLSTVAIVAASDDVPLDAFTCEIVHSLLAIGKFKADNDCRAGDVILATPIVGPTLHLTQQLIIDRFGDSVLESINDYRLSAWLGQQEELHRIVVYQCDKKLTPWTKRSLRQADCILVVGIGWKEPVKGSVSVVTVLMHVSALTLSFVPRLNTKSNALPFVPRKNSYSCIVWVV